ncbi:hypothetical protein JTB14_015023 [Gonioctena quinquepunctata]|nr:hypothetical protein JTB14_015023 [Gonioctena quinquepunctata]
MSAKGYTCEEYTDMILAMGEAKCVAAVAVRIYQEKHPGRKAPVARTMTALVKRLRRTGSFFPETGGNHPRMWLYSGNTMNKPLLKWSPAVPMKRPDNIISSKAREKNLLGFKPSYENEPKEHMQLLMSNEYSRKWFAERAAYEKDTYTREKISKKKTKSNEENIEKRRSPAGLPSSPNYEKMKYKPQCFLVRKANKSAKPGQDEKPIYGQKEKTIHGQKDRDLGEVPAKKGVPVLNKGDNLEIENVCGCVCLCH